LNSLKNSKRAATRPAAAGQAPFDQRLFAIEAFGILLASPACFI